jgi:hypothetical protein
MQMFSFLLKQTVHIVTTMPLRLNLISGTLYPRSNSVVSHQNMHNLVVAYLRHLWEKVGTIRICSGANSHSCPTYFSPEPALWAAYFGACAQGIEVLAGVSINKGVKTHRVRRILRKRSHLKAYKLPIIQHLQSWIVCTPLSVNFLVTLATEQLLEYPLKLFFKHPALPVEVTLNRNYPR